MAFLRQTWFGLARRFLVAILLLSGAATAQAQSSSPREYQVKAVFLYNFAQFVSWPRDAFVDARSPFVIGVLGEDPFGPFLDDAVQAERIADRPLVIERYRQIEQVRVCHILFIGRSEAARLDAILASCRGRPILTVSDMESFASRGGIIRFVSENNKVRFRVNVDVARAAELTISSKLLRSAGVVSTEKE